MATMPAPSTPQSHLSQAAISTPSPGSWQHPKSDEIARRQKANTFDDSNLRKVVWNSGALIALYFASQSYWSRDLLSNRLVGPVATPLLYVFSLLMLYNLFIAFLPLLKTKDELTDVALTPTQRKLLGLEPTATPPLTPGTQYITPPRYSHLPTPRNMSSATRNNSTYSTPIAQSPSFGREGSDSPTGPAGSPLWQKSIGRTRDPARRSSYGTPSPLGPGFGGREGSIMGAPSTPSPTAGRGASVGLNSKWLYNKGRSNSGSRGMF